MDISKKLIIFSVIINILAIIACVICVVLTKFNTTVLLISLAVLIFVFVTSIITVIAGKRFK